MKAMKNIRICLLAAMLIISATASAGSNHYSKAVANVVSGSIGRGTVYVEAPSGGTNGEKGNTSAAKKTENTTGNPTHNYSFQVNSTTAGYEFDGWYANETGGDKIESNLTGTTLSVSVTASSTSEDSPSTETRYARWNPKLYTINLDDDGADVRHVSPYSITVHYNDDDYSSAITYPKKGGVAFRGFRTAKNGGGTKIINGSGNVLANVSGYTSSGKWIYTTTDEITLYAEWGEKELPEETSTPAATYHVGDVVDLEECWTTESDGTRTFSIVDDSFEADDGNHDGCPSVPTMGADEHTVTFSKAGTLTLRMVVAEGTNHLGTTIDKSITIVRNDPVFTWNSANTPYYYKSSIADIFTTDREGDTTFVSDNEHVAKVMNNTLHIYNVAETAHIQITQAETYYWSRKDTTVTITPVDNLNTIPMPALSTWTNDIRDIYVISCVDDDSEAWLHDECIDICYNNPNYAEDKYMLFAFEGVPDSLLFKYKVSNTSNTSYWYIIESASSSVMTDTIWVSDVNSNSWSEMVRIKLSPTTRYLKLGHIGKVDAQFKELQIKALPNAFNADVDTLNFGLQGQNYGWQVKTTNFHHANAGRITSVNLIGADKDYYTINLSSIAGTGREKYGTSLLRVSFNNQDDRRNEDVPYNAKVVFADNNEHKDTIVLVGYRNGKNVPEFTWNPNDMAYYFGTTITVPAVSNNTAADLTYTSSNTGVAEIVNGKIVINSTASPVTIRVSQAETTEFRAHYEDYTFTPRNRPSLSVPFALTESVFGGSCVTVADGSRCGWSDGCMWIGGGFWQASDYWHNGKRVVVEFAGTPEILSFTIKNTYLAIDPRWKIEESPDGADNNWTEVWYKSQTYRDWHTESEIQLKPTTQFLRFSYGGNYSGYFKDITITALDGTKYMIANEKYLSRGGAWGTQAVLDDFGTPVRVTRYTTDNSNIYTKVQFMDSREYLYETGDAVYTDNITASSANILWTQTVSDGKVIVQSANGGGKYITITDGKLAMTADASQATKWEVEDYKLHESRIRAKINAWATTAVTPVFGSGVNTLEKIQGEIEHLDFATTSVTIDALAEEEKEQKGNYKAEGGVADLLEKTKSGLDPGLYRLSIQALYRTSASPVDWENHDDGIESVVGYIYANDTKYPIKSLFDETGGYNAPIGGGAKDTLAGDGFYYANNYDAADAMFDADADNYRHDLYVYVEADEGETTGTLNYGIKNPSYVPGAWIACDNISLTKIERKRFVFTGTADSDWTDVSNWTYGGDPVDKVPGEAHNVTINHNVQISGAASAYSVTINANDTVFVLPTGGLTVGAGGISFGDKASLHLRADSASASLTKGQTGYFRLSPYYEGAMPEATVEMFSKVYYNPESSDDDNAASWQCVGVPVADAGVKVSTFYPNNYIYSWRESKDGWVNTRKNLECTPFVGFETTQKTSDKGMLITHKGHLTPFTDGENPNWTMKLDYTSADKGYNLLANSFTAPIDISQFKSGDFTNAEQTIYILNAGTKGESNAPNAELENDAPGKFVGIPIETAEELVEDGYPVVIAPMQGFWVKATGEEASLKLDYTQLVWGINYSGDRAAKPLRAPKQKVGENEAEEDATITGKLKVSIYGGGWNDFVYLLESDSYDAAYEDGYDAHKIPSGGMDIYTIEGDDELGVDATNSLIGTKIGLRTGEEYEYTMKFSRVQTEDDLALLDKEEGKEIDIEEGTEYAFFATQNATITDRFEIVSRGNAPAITTGTDGVNAEVKAQKFIKNNSLYIYKDGVLYNALGERVR